MAALNPRPNAPRPWRPRKPVPTRIHPWKALSAFGVLSKPVKKGTPMSDEALGKYAKAAFKLDWINVFLIILLVCVFIHPILDSLTAVINVLRGML